MTSAAAEDVGAVTYAQDGPVAVVTLDRPSAHNATTLPMIQQLDAAMERARTDGEIRVIVLTGAGTKAFSAGGDLASLIPLFTAGQLHTLIPDPTQRYFSHIFKPIIAAVNGLCIAGGVEMLLGTDLRIASDTAKFGLAETRWGLVPTAGSHVRLPQQVPWAIAMQMLLTAEPIDAQRALSAGLVNEVLPVEKVLPRAMELAHQISRNAPMAVQAAKEIAVRALGNEQRFPIEYEIGQRVLASEDAREGPRAFMEKRKPVYRGR